MVRLLIFLLSTSLGWGLFLSATSAPAGFKGEIVFGSGGGFTGKETVFTLSRDGKLTESVMGKPGIQVATWVPMQIKTAFKMAGKVDFRKPFHQPGNMYFFVAQQVDGKTTRITWGNDQQPPAAAQALYKYLMAQMQQPAEQ